MNPSMETEPRLRIRDNPLLVAQARRRMRPRALYTNVGIVGIMSFWVMYMAIQSPDGFGWQSAQSAGFIFVGFLLFLRATSVVSSVVTFDRTSGLLDFHRATPTSSLSDAFGYMVGSAANEYIGAAIAGSMAFLAMLMGGLNPLSAVLVLAVLLVTALNYQALALFFGLVIQRERAAKGAASAVVLGLLIFGSVVSLASIAPLYHLTPYPSLAALGVYGNDLQVFADASVPLFGLRLHPVLYTFIMQIFSLTFFLWGACRKLGLAEAVPVARRASLIFGTGFMVLTLGSLWPLLPSIAHPPNLENMAEKMVDSERLGDVIDTYQRAVMGSVMLIVVYIASFAMLLRTAAPRYLHAGRAIRRARLKNREYPHWLEDGAPMDRLFLVLTGLAILGTAGVAFQASDGSIGVVFSPPFLLTYFTIVAVLGLMTYLTTYGRLVARKGRKGKLVTFGVIVGPLLLSSAMQITNVPWDLVQYVLALSPLTCIFAAPINAISVLGDVPLEINMAAVLVSISVSSVGAFWARAKTRDAWQILKK